MLGVAAVTTTAWAHGTATATRERFLAANAAS
jgi:hypothetical protein